MTSQTASPDSRPRVLVTGAAGFTGHHMVMQAARAGLRLRATDVSSRHYGALFDALDVEFVAADLTRREGLDRLLEGVDAVFHVAGIHDYSTPDEIIFAVNVKAVENLCDAAVAAGVGRFIHLSSVGVFGYGYRSGVPVKEDAEKLTPPLNNYNVSKWEGEKIVHHYQREKGLRTTIFRPAAIYGPRSEYGLFNAFKRIYDSRHKRRMLMAGKGDRIEAFLHVEDMCRAVLFALERDETVGEIYNISDESRMTTAEFFLLVSRELVGAEKPFLRVPMRLLLPLAAISQRLAKWRKTQPALEVGTLHYLSCDRCWDSSKLLATGFELMHPSAVEGLRETLQWYRENGWFRS
ncbi:MAG: NAD(P)-dependent oxidoreductase [Deltaproteobacteria bacterium]|nr:NAD(P)-dependent oxidoreductase [Deltaproteobacteria bacterium]